MKLIGYVWIEGELNVSLQTICKKVVAIMHGRSFHSEIDQYLAFIK